MWGKCPACAAKDAEIERMAADKQKLLDMIQGLTEQGIAPKRPVQQPSPAPLRAVPPRPGHEPRLIQRTKPSFAADLALGGHVDE
jgi:hypothetical protein